MKRIDWVPSWKLDFVGMSCDVVKYHVRLIFLSVLVKLVARTVSWVNFEYVRRGHWDNLSSDSAGVLTLLRIYKLQNLRDLQFGTPQGCAFPMQSFFIWDWIGTCKTRGTWAFLTVLSGNFAKLLLLLVSWIFIFSCRILSIVFTDCIQCSTEEWRCKYFPGW